MFVPRQLRLDRSEVCHLTQHAMTIAAVCGVRLEGVAVVIAEANYNRFECFGYDCGICDMSNERDCDYFRDCFDAEDPDDVGGISGCVVVLEESEA